MINVLTPTMIFERKFKTQEEDPVVGNDLCNKEFKSYFSFFDPRATPISNKDPPNCKSKEFLKYEHDENLKA